MSACSLHVSCIVFMYHIWAYNVHTGDLPMWFVGCTTQVAFLPISLVCTLKSTHKHPSMRADGRTTDAYPWQKLTWPLARWAKNKLCSFYDVAMIIFVVRTRFLIYSFDLNVSIVLILSSNMIFKMSHLYFYPRQTFSRKPAVANWEGSNPSCC